MELKNHVTRRACDPPCAYKLYRTYLSQFGSVRPIDLTTVSAEIVTHTVTEYVWEHMFLNDICD
jgi:hypothetical protein